MNFAGAPPLAKQPVTVKGDLRGTLPVDFSERVVRVEIEKIKRLSNL